MKYYYDFEHDLHLTSADQWELWKADEVLRLEYGNEFPYYMEACMARNNGVLILDENKQDTENKVETNVALSVDEARELKWFLNTIGVEWHSTEYYDQILVLLMVSETERTIVDEWLQMYTK